MSKKYIGTLPSLSSFLAKFPLLEEQKQIVETARKNAEDILLGKSGKKLVIVGPCSADFRDSVLEYAHFIRAMREKHGNTLEIIMRLYTGKPRTIGGWKGLMMSYPGEDANLEEWLAASRSLALEILSLQVPIADEILYPHLSEYFEDSLSYAAIGARSVENQYHREVVSGLDFPVGLKNPTSGDLGILANSVKAAMSPALFSIGENIFETSGNPFVHGILRGGSNGSNYDEASLLQALKALGERNIVSPSLLIDASHGNSNKNPLNQPSVVESVLATMKNHPSINQLVKGFMIESYLFDGRQDYFEECTHGLSLTDGCLGIEKTEILLEKIWQSNI